MMNLQKEALEKSRFQNYRASSRLRVLAANPPDLTSNDFLTPQRFDSYMAQGCGFQLNYATQRVDDDILEALQELAEEAHVVDFMRRQQQGEILNKIVGYPSEERPVLHTAVRDFFDNPQQEAPAQKAAQLARQECEKLQNFLHQIKDQFTDLVMIGIGGSNLGPEAIYLALQAYKLDNRNVHFVSNIDPDNLSEVLEGLDLKRTLVGVVSKSGTTTETITNESFAREFFRKAKLQPEDHFIAITGEKSAMDDRKKYKECFYIWDYVGGRFSGTAMPGGVLLSFAFGFDAYWELLRGAHDIDKNALNSNLKENIPLLMALLEIWNHNFLGYPTCCIVPYSHALRRFSAHIQQVDMESNGKHIDKHGYPVTFQTSPVIFGEPGTNAQHSFFQMMHQGTQIVPHEFIGFRRSQRESDTQVQGTSGQEKLLANLLAQALALATGKQNGNPNKVFKGNRPSLILMTECLTPYTMGILYALYEHKVVFQGYVWDINSFDQEGVMLGKEMANEILSCFAARHGEAKSSFPLGDHLIDLFGLE